MISAMTSTTEPEANILCKSCGLCCTGHLFVWTKLRSVELGPIEALGVEVLNAVPSQRGFNQPCPLWHGQCTIYTSSHYPRFCSTYKCKLLRQLIDEETSLPEASAVIGAVKEQIREIESLLPVSSNPNFRERLADYLEDPAEDNEELRRKALSLVSSYGKVFDVTDVIE